jgi:shikimate dehydrogenase
VDLTSYDLIVNTTPAGAADLIAEQVQPKPLGLFFDVIYKPWPTVLARKWSDCGGEVINGLELLIYQGIDQLTLALNMEIDKEDLARHLRPILKS